MEGNTYHDIRVPNVSSFFPLSLDAYIYLLVCFTVVQCSSGQGLLVSIIELNSNGGQGRTKYDLDSKGVLITALT